MSSLARLVIVLHLYLAFGDSHDTDTILFHLHRFAINYFTPHRPYIILLSLCFVHSHSAFEPHLVSFRVLILHSLDYAAILL